MFFEKPPQPYFVNRGSSECRQAKDTEKIGDGVGGRQAGLSRKLEDKVERHQAIGI